MNYRTALELAREAFKSGDLSYIEEATEAIESVLAQPEQDWSMLEAMQGSLREHMARIKELESQRKPLMDEEILTYRHMIDWTAEWSYINFARAIEAAHGIKEQP